MACASFGISIIRYSVLKKFFTVIALGALLSLGCGALSLIAQPSPAPTLEPTGTTSPTPSPFQPVPATLTLSPTDTPTAPPSETPLPTFTFTPTPTPEPQWYLQGPNEVVVPILLYHHIGVSPSDSLYYVPPYAFEQQMVLLDRWGYQTISVELLVKALKQGAELPPKPIILTFDDGSGTTYTNALPIMQKYNFIGTAFIVTNYIGIPNYMTVDQIRELYAAGWEIGSHGLNHTNLTENPARQMDEIVESRRRLESLLGLPVMSFAYPFGAYDRDSVSYAHSAGYIAALGLGDESLQANKNLFYLYRQAVTGTDDLRAFAQLLPWREDQLPVITIVP